MLWLFRRFTDPVAHREVEEDRRRQRENVPPDADGASGGEVILPARDDPQRRFTCRVCQVSVQLRADDPRYCAGCLAETLELTRYP